MKCYESSSKQQRWAFIWKQSLNNENSFQNLRENGRKQLQRNEEIFQESNSHVEITIFMIPRVRKLLIYLMLRSDYILNSTFLGEQEHAHQMDRLLRKNLKENILPLKIWLSNIIRPLWNLIKREREKAKMRVSFFFFFTKRVGTFIHPFLVKKERKKNFKKKRTERHGYLYISFT